MMPFAVTNTAFLEVEFTVIFSKTKLSDRRRKRPVGCKNR